MNMYNYFRLFFIAFLCTGSAVRHAHLSCKPRCQGGHMRHMSRHLSLARSNHVGGQWRTFSKARLYRQAYRPSISHASRSRRSSSYRHGHMSYKPSATSQNYQRYNEIRRSILNGQRTKRYSRQTFDRRAHKHNITDRHARLAYNPHIHRSHIHRKQPTHTSHFHYVESSEDRALKSRLADRFARQHRNTPSKQEKWSSRPYSGRKIWRNKDHRSSGSSGFANFTKPMRNYHHWRDNNRLRWRSNNSNNLGIGNDLGFSDWPGGFNSVAYGGDWVGGGWDYPYFYPIYWPLNFSCGAYMSSWGSGIGCGFGGWGYGGGYYDDY